VIALVGVRVWPHAPLRQRISGSTGVWSADGELLRVTLSADDQYRLWVPLAQVSPSVAEAFLLKEAKLFRAELKMPLILLGGITNRETMDLAMAEGFDFVAMARALLAEPDLINRIKDDGDAHTIRSKCTHCNKCMATIYSHTHCVVTGSPG